MKILTFGTCRILNLFSNNDNETFLQSLHTLNYDSRGGKNIIALTHDIYQVLFVLDIIINKKNIYEIPLINNFSAFLSDVGDYRNNYLSVEPEFNIMDSVLNINKELFNIKYIVIEVCTLKKLIKNNVPFFLDINDHNYFINITDDEFKDNFRKLVETIMTINKDIKIIFVSHIIKYDNTIIQERKHVLDLLVECCTEFTNTYVLSPCDYINDHDLIDNRHYKNDKKYKITNAIKDKILDIESEIIVNHMNHTGFLKFNILEYLNNYEIISYKNLYNKLQEMQEEIITKKMKKDFTIDNNYLYSINNSINEKYNINNSIFIDFFRIVLNDLIVKIAEKYLENDVYIYNPLIAVNYNYQDDRCQSQNWHRDPGGIKIIKFFFFFDNVDVINGAFEYIPNTQYTSKSKITNIFEYRGESIYPVNYSHFNEYNDFLKLSSQKSIQVNCDNYDCLSVDTSGFHRAGLCHKNNYRKYLHVLYMTENSIINSNDKCDNYIKGFNYNKDLYDVDIENIDLKIGKNISKYFYNKC
jgi:hypothetical protein